MVGTGRSVVWDGQLVTDSKATDLLDWFWYFPRLFPTVHGEVTFKMKLCKWGLMPAFDK